MIWQWSDSSKTGSSEAVLQALKENPLIGTGRVSGKLGIHCPVWFDSTTKSAKSNQSYRIVPQFTKKEKNNNPCRYSRHLHLDILIYPEF